VNIRTGFNYFRTGFSCRILRTRWWNFCSIKERNFLTSLATINFTTNTGTWWYRDSLVATTKFAICALNRLWPRRIHVCQQLNLVSSPASSWLLVSDFRLAPDEVLDGLFRRDISLRVLIENDT
jgi:hypothetical protein